MDTGLLVAIVGFAQGITVAIVSVVGKIIISKQNKAAKKTRAVAIARDKEQVAFKQQIKSAITLTSHLTTAIQTGQTNGYITKAWDKFKEDVEDAEDAEMAAQKELDNIYKTMM